MQLSKCRHVCSPILHWLDVPDHSWFHLQSTQVVFHLLGFGGNPESTNGAVPMRFYSWNSCLSRSLCFLLWLETQWMCWRSDHPQKNPKLPLHWSLILCSGGSGHSPGRTERDWFTFTTAELVQTPGKAGPSELRWRKINLSAQVRPSLLLQFHIWKHSPGLKPFPGFQPVPGQEQQERGQPVPGCGICGWV